jgi:hypothetical protein
LKRKRGIFFQKGKNRKPYIIELQQEKKKRGKNEKKKKKKTYLACYCSRHMLMNICAL